MKSVSIHPQFDPLTRGPVCDGAKVETGMKYTPYRVASRWAIYDPGGVLVYVASTHEEEPTACWEIWTGWEDSDEIADRQRQGYRCIRVYVTPR